MGTCTPLPSSASKRLSGDDKCFVTATETAAVCISVINRPSMTARGSPVSGQTAGSLRGVWERLCLRSRVKAHELKSHRVPSRDWHNTEIALTFLDREHVAEWLNDATGRERGERRLHFGYERIPTKDCADTCLVQIPHYCSPKRSS